ncbi:hypothetical protein [Anaerosolibacter sp.]|uniref:hypothetical protein n=1 Tax=Anaerosolibacter sp. TaxID=1872527 RepID=UPI0039F0D0B3
MSETAAVKPGCGFLGDNTNLLFFFLLLVVLFGGWFNEPGCGKGGFLGGFGDDSSLLFFFLLLIVLFGGPFFGFGRV